MCTKQQTCQTPNTIFDMGRGPTVSTDKRAQIVELSDAGFTERRIAQQLHCSKTAAHNAIRRVHKTGSNGCSPRSGQPRVSTARDDAYQCQIARMRRKLTARTLNEEWIPMVGRGVSIQTVRIRLVTILRNCNIP